MYPDIEMFLKPSWQKGLKFKLGLACQKLSYLKEDSVFMKAFQDVGLYKAYVKPANMYKGM